MSMLKYTLEFLLEENEKLNNELSECDKYAKEQYRAYDAEIKKLKAVAEAAKFAIRAYEWPREDNLRACGQGCDGNKTYGHASDCPFPPLAKALYALEGK